MNLRGHVKEILLQGYHKRKDINFSTDPSILFIKYE